MDKTRIRIKRIPSAAFGGQKGFGLNINVFGVAGKSPANPNIVPKPYEVNNYLKEVPEEFANVEAERGETALGDFDNDGNLEHLNIGGERHANGGTPLNVPAGTFIFSDTKKMRIKDKAVLGMFGKTKPSTPAALAKSYDLNKYKAILDNPQSDAYEKKTAEMMLAGNTDKLKKLALVQEGMKGFPQGVPQVAAQAKARYGGYVPRAQAGMVMLPDNSRTGYNLPNKPGDDIQAAIDAENNYVSDSRGPVFQVAPYESENKQTVTPGTAQPYPYPQTAQDAPPPAIQFSGSKVPFQYMAPDMRNVLDRALDFVNTHKYMPWSAPYHAVTPTPVYYDPARELAAAQSNRSAQLLTAAMSGNPKTFRAMASAMSGADDVANIIGKYNNLNVGEANKAAQYSAQVTNDAGMYEARRKSEDNRNTAVVDQQYDNSLKQNYGAFTQAENQAWNNRMMLNKINNNSEHYYTDPVTGKTVLKSGLDLTSMPPSSGNNSDTSDQMLKEIDALSKKYPNINSSTLYQLVRQKYGMGTVSTVNRFTGVRTRSMGYLGNPMLYGNGQNPYPQNAPYPNEEY